MKTYQKGKNQRYKEILYSNQELECTHSTLFYYTYKQHKHIAALSQIGKIRDIRRYCTVIKSMNVHIHSTLFYCTYMYAAW
jgi:hypothetical protein